MAQFKLANHEHRNSRGQAATVLNLFIALFVVLALGCLSFEYSRYMLARDELKTCVDIAALTAQTAFESLGCPGDQEEDLPTQPTEAENESTAIATALTAFKQNSILGQPMVDVSIFSALVKA